MKCPKCSTEMNERNMRTLQGKVTFDQCPSCEGFWFDTGEAEIIKDQYRPDFIDHGDPKTGKELNEVRDVNCPRCGNRMDKIADAKQRHIKLETCPAHGVFMDAGEFRDYKNETLMDVFKGVVARIRGD